MSEHFCTYFDHRYAPKGLAMWRSLKARDASAHLHVLCLNDACREILAPLGLKDVHLHSLGNLEDEEPGLLSARGNRSLVEYYFTLTPCLPLHVFRTQPTVRRVTYVDADLYFFADPGPVFDEIGDCSIGIIEHRFPERLNHLEIHGRFNVGWLTFRNDDVGVSCLTDWRDECLEWCYDRVEPGRFAEQKYLDQWPERFGGVHVVQHKGANLAPWNLDRFNLTDGGKQLTVDGAPLLFFHAHGFQAASPGRARNLNLDSYGVAETPLLNQFIFDPYEHALKAAATEIAQPLALALLSDESLRSNLTFETVQSQLASIRAQLASASAQLADSESDRNARLEAIRTLQRELDESNADRATRLELIRRLERDLEQSAVDRAAIQTLQAQVTAREADSAARLDVIQSMQRELEQINADRAARLEVIHRLELDLEASRNDRAAHLDLIQQLQAGLSDATVVHTALQEQLAASDADRAARLEVIRRLEQELEASQIDRAARLDLIHKLQSDLNEASAARTSLQEQLTASETDRAERLKVLQHQQSELAAIAADSAARLELIYTLQRDVKEIRGRLDSSQAEVAGRLADAQKLQRELQAAHAEQAAGLETIQALQAELEVAARHMADTQRTLTAAQSRITDLESSRSWRWTRPLRWIASLLGSQKPDS